MPQYSDERINERNKSGKDAQRAAKNTELFNKATQPPHDDDQWAREQLAIRGSNDAGGGLATNDARNHALMLLSKLDGSTPEYHEERDGGGFMGSVGGVLKKLSPLAGMIPGIGLPIGALAGAAGSALGGAMQGDKFDLGKTLLSGASSGLLAHANPFGDKIPDAPDTHAMGSQTYTPDGKPYVASQHVPGGGAPGHGSAPSAPGGGILGKLGKIDLGQVANVAGKGMEVLDRRSTRKANERFQNSSLQMRQKQLGMAEDSYAERAPLRQTAISRLGRMRGASIFGG